MSGSALRYQVFESGTNMATILRRNLIYMTEGPVTLLDASYHSQHPDRVILYFSKTTDIDQIHINPPWRVVDRISVDGAWPLHLEHGEDAPVSLVLFGAHHQLKPAHITGYYSRQNHLFGGA